MTDSNYLQQISEQERRALAICGISKAEQLVSISRDALLTEVLKATEHFPQEMPLLMQTVAFCHLIH